MDQLYWVTEEYPTEYMLWGEDLPYEGGYAALDYACRQKPGRGVYANSVQIVNSSGNFPGMKAGYCKVKIGNSPVTYPGALYSAYLYCNGKKRDIMDNSGCGAQEPVNRNENLGPCDLQHN